MEDWIIWAIFTCLIAAGAFVVIAAIWSMRESTWEATCRRMWKRKLKEGHPFAVYLHRAGNQDRFTQQQIDEATKNWRAYEHKKHIARVVDAQPFI